MRTKELLTYAAGMAALGLSGFDVPTAIPNGKTVTGKGNETKPIGTFKNKKKAFGVQKLSRKQRKAKK